MQHVRELVGERGAATRVTSLLYLVPQLHDPVSLAKALGRLGSPDRPWTADRLSRAVRRLVGGNAGAAGGKAREVLVKKDYFEEVDAQLR